MMKFMYFLTRAFFGVVLFWPALMVSKMFSAISDLFYFLETDKASYFFDDIGMFIEKKVMKAYYAIGNEFSIENETDL